VPFASEDAHSSDVMRSEASSDAEAVLRFERLSEKALMYLQFLALFVYSLSGDYTRLPRLRPS
jgi:hypothetical protein